MLSELRITNFAIIEQLDLRFGTALTTFTGETGAGKSIIIDAVETLLGSRVDATMIRTESDLALIEATFQINPLVREAVHAILSREDLLDDPDFLTLSREIRRRGRNVARVNGRSVNVALLRVLGEILVDVHGQSEHLSLLRVPEHVRLLDSYADVAEPLQAYRSTYRRLQQVRRDLQKLRESERDAARRTDLLRYQIDEIETANLEIGEDEELKAEQSRLANAENLSKLAQHVTFLLDEGDPESQSGSDLIGQAVQNLHQLARTDPSQAPLYERAQELSENLNDLIADVRDYLENIEFNPRRLKRVGERLDLLYHLKRKYGDTLEEVLQFSANAAQELEAITTAEERLEALQIEEAALLKQLAKDGMALSQSRKEAAESLSRSIEAELNELRMDGASFAVDFQVRPDPDGVLMPDGSSVAFGPTGLESVQFLVAPNPGEGLKPLAKIASGGEMSRLMLALKHVLAQADTTPTLIFDEIDQGIGGRIGAVVGRKLWRLGRQHQVLCVTHLPQLAAFGSQHMRVHKVVHQGRTATLVETLDGPQREEELALMLGNISEGTLKSAREILSTVEKQTA